MKKQSTSIDGFIPRRSGNKLGDRHIISSGPKKRVLQARPLHDTGENVANNIGEPRMGMSIGRSEIDESLRDIDQSQEPVKKPSRRQRRRARKKSKRPHGKIHRILKPALIILAIILFGFGAFAAYKFFMAGSSIFQGNIFGIIQNEPLKQDKNGRSNFLILGTSEDDPGHGGADLTDSMMIASIDQKNKNIYMFSIPRDLYVEYGEGCTSGYSGKINAYFACSNTDTTKEAEQDRLSKTQKLVGDIFGIEVQYGVHVNQSVIRDAVDAVGGVDVDVQGSGGAPGVLDRNFDWRCNYKCYLVKYDNGVHHLDGTHALFLAQARGDVAPTYGLANSNFDREKNQQKILIALKAKAMSTGTLTNFGTITKLIDSFGDNLRTNIQSTEIRTLMDAMAKTKAGDVHTISLFASDTNEAVVASGPYNGASVVMPSAGIYDYSDLQAYIKKNLSSNVVVREAAPIVVLNGSGQPGYGQTKADALTGDGYNVVLVDNAPDGTYGKVEVYQIGTGNSGTAKKLASRYKVKIKKTTPPIAVESDVKFVIVFGVAS